MATLAQGAITSSDAQYRNGYSSKLYLEGIVKNPINRIFTEAGVINREDDLSMNKGGTVTMYNDIKINAKGNTGDNVDLYSSAILTETNSRTINIALNSLSIQWPLKGTQSAQYAPYEIGQNNTQKLSDWSRSLVSASYLNQVAGNTATSITQYALDTSAFSSAADLLRITGNNAASVPTYHYWGSTAGTAKTTDASITSGETLTIGDFQFAAEVLTSQPASGQPIFQPLANAMYIGIAVISITGFNQLLNEAKTLGQGFQAAELIMREVQAGKSIESDIQSFIIPGLPFKFIVVPDSWLPRGVNSSSGAEVANSRRAVIVGRNALDVAFGQGFNGGGGAIPGADIEFDTTYKKLNKQGFGAAKLLWGCKKTQSTAAGSGSTTAYDMAAYVICHYSRT